MAATSLPPVTSEPLAADDSVSITDDDASTLTSASITSSVLDYTYSNGRRYQSFRATGDQYFLPNDEGEQQRLDLLHHIFLLTLQGRLYNAPFMDGGKAGEGSASANANASDEPKRVLDLGTGTGIWATQLADELPDVQVVGVDVSPIQAGWVPENVRFFVDDVELPWTYGADEGFDFIHQRALAGAVKDWPALLKEAFKHTRPGGWYEAQEFPIAVTSDDGTHEKAVNVIDWCRNVEKACEQQGRPISITRQLKGWLEDAGFVDVVEKTYKVPLNPWPKDPHLKEIGKYYLVQSFEAAESFILQLYTKVLGKSMEETRAFIDVVRKELADRSIHLYAEYVFVWGRKPAAGGGGGGGEE